MTRRKWVLGAVAVALVAGGAFYAWHRSRPVPTPVPLAAVPEIPPAVTDADVRAALTRAREKVLAEPQSGQAWGELGLIYRAHHLNAESNACFATAARLDPQNPRWPYLIGAINLLQAPDDALPHLRTAYDLATEREHKSLIRLRLAEALLDRADLDGAARLFTEELRTDPLSARAQFGLGAGAATRGDDRAAVGALLLAVDSPFAHRKASALLAASYRRLGNAAESERFEREAARGGDDLQWPDRFMLEYQQREVGRSARMKAVEEFEATGRLSEAVAELEAVARNSPDDLVLVSLGINLAKMGDLGRAERVLRAVVARSPDHAVARYFLGISLYQQAERAWRADDRAWAKPRFEEAVRELRRAAELKPDKGLAHLYAGLALKYLGNLPEAADECRAALRASPQIGEVHFGMAQVLVALDKSAEAVPYLETAVRLSPPSDTRAKALLEGIVGKKP